jgi:hypothetical protein
MQHFVGVAPENQRPKAGATVGSHDDDIGFGGLGGRDDLRRGMTDGGTADDGGDRDARLFEDRDLLGEKLIDVFALFVLEGAAALAIDDLSLPDVQ